MIGQTVESSKSPEASDDRQNRWCLIYGLHSRNLACIVAINGLQCRVSLKSLVGDTGKREIPVAPPGLGPKLRLEDTFYLGEHFGQFINMVHFSGLNISSEFWERGTGINCSRFTVWQPRQYSTRVPGSLPTGATRRLGQDAGRRGHK